MYYILPLVFINSLMLLIIKVITMFEQTDQYNIACILFIKVTHTYNNNIIFENGRRINAEEIEYLHLLVNKMLK